MLASRVRPAQVAKTFTVNHGLLDEGARRGAAGPQGREGPHACEPLQHEAQRAGWQAVDHGNVGQEAAPHISERGLSGR